MFERIVVGTDGSSTASAALMKAAQLAAQFGAELHIVSGYQPKSGVMVSGKGAAVEDWAVSSRYEVEAILRDAESKARTKGASVATHDVTGDAGKALVKVAKKVEADLVVVGNRGMKGVKRFLLGSVPNDVAHNAPCAVLILKTT